METDRQISLVNENSDRVNEESNFSLPNDYTNDYNSEKEKVIKRRSFSAKRASHCWNEPPKETDIGSSSNAENVLPSKTAHFVERTKELEKENTSWKQLLKTNSALKEQAQREYQEAVDEETAIEEDDVYLNLPTELKAILDTRPDYKKYRQQVKIAKEKTVLTKLKLEQFATKQKLLMDASKIHADIYYKAVEKETMLNNQSNDVKTLLRNLQDRGTENMLEQ